MFLSLFPVSSLPFTVPLPDWRTESASRPQWLIDQAGHISHIMQAHRYRMAHVINVMLYPDERIKSYLVDVPGIVYPGNIALLRDDFEQFVTHTSPVRLALYGTGGGSLLRVEAPMEMA